MITNFKIFEKVSDYNINRIVNGNYETILDFLLKNNAFVNKKDDYTNRTPLINAARSNKLSILNKLLNAGAEVDSVDNFGYTALLYAAQNFADKISSSETNIALDIIISLTKFGANWNVQDNDGFDIFRFLNDADNEKLIQMFPDKYNDYIIAKDAEIYNL